MQEIQTIQNDSGNDFGLLDIIVPLAENLMVIVGGTLLAGLISIAIAFAIPKSYLSTAILAAPVQTTSGQPNSGSPELVIASLMNSAPVVDAVIDKFNFRGVDAIETAREKLREDVKVVVNRNDKLITLNATAETAERAQAIANAVLDQTYLESRPKNDEKARLLTQIEAAKMTEKLSLDAAAILAKKMAESKSGDIALGYADLLRSAAEGRKVAAQLEDRMRSVSPSNLIQAPTLPQKAEKPKKKLITVVATLGTLLGFMLFYIFRHLLSSQQIDSSSAAKLARIRRALRMGTA